MSDEEKLKKIRERIDELDAQIQELISRRAGCAQGIARIKHRNGEGEACYRPEREAMILRDIQARNRGPLSDEEMARLFREIMSACLALEQPLKIAFLGPEGTFTQAAALKHFGHSVATLPLATIPEVFREVESGNAHYGVVPVENSTEGMISHTLDMFLGSDLKISGEVQLRVHHHLMASAGEMDSVVRVYSHQQSFAQCREWLDSHLPNAERVPVSSNAEAARRAAGEEGSAAIAGDVAAELYGLDIVAQSIEDEPDNTTRFLVVGRHPVARSGTDKTSLLVSSTNRAGALYRLLSPFSQHGINLTRVESRPSRRGVWEYVFFIDIEGHAEDDPVARALEELAKEASLLKVLGSYPKAVM
ncbi:MAG: prephenate dehydratase [Gammaproteobacteria bacterium]|nr:prephenate dehydratase [Gammaproteobacteria bacterium]NIR96562.1 prephenate dehydratase [Gammaproteobacteria bacterium]NIT62300.1 prephenate dehydratase [Gammaproteobacteria bacterium]NIV19204.1 prephenate dehydratase [Gammaproteobacteria bacterium]NIX10072.1 prephenate dehydratase [Gammaproteobacteria bacterium]